MRKSIFSVLVVTATLVGFGCARPNRITAFKSPTDGVFFTVETYYGHGPLSSDITRVYAHFERNGKATKVLILDGDNLTVTNVIWKGPREDTLCLNGGTTSTFHNQVTLILGDSPDKSETIHSYIQEYCPRTGSPSG